MSEEQNSAPPEILEKLPANPRSNKRRNAIVLPETSANYQHLKEESGTKTIFDQATNHKIQWSGEAGMKG